MPICEPVGHSNPAKTEIDIRDYVGFDPTGVSDCSVAFNNAIGALPVNGGAIVVPSDAICKLTAPIIMGNGSSTAWSTRQGVRIICKSAGSSNVLTLSNPTPLGATFISEVAGPAFRIDGPMAGWGMENLHIQFNTSSTAARGIQIYSGQHGQCNHVYIEDCPGVAVELNTRFPYTGFGIRNSMMNIFMGLSIRMAHANVTGILFTADSSGWVNSSLNTFNGLNIIPLLATQTAIHLAGCDTNIFLNTLVTGGAAAIGVKLDYTVNTTWPTDNKFYGIDIGDNTFVNVGTPRTPPWPPNFIFGLGLSNGTGTPNLPGLAIVNGNANSYVSATLPAANTILAGTVVLVTDAVAGAQAKMATATGWINLG